jgi:hypothetical protein
VAANNGRVQFGLPVKSKSHRRGALGRVCQADGCTTVLSIYNNSDDCSLHEHRSLKSSRERI